MIEIVVDSGTSNFQVKNQLDAQLPSALLSAGIDIYSSDVLAAKNAAAYIKACGHTNRSIRHIGAPTQEQIDRASRISAPPSSPSHGQAGALKAGVENLSGYSPNDVKVHYNSNRPASLQAHAYAHGTNIHIAPGQERHLPQEGWHVVQQAEGRVKSTTQL